MADEANTESTEQAQQTPSVDELMEQLKALQTERDKAVEQSRKWETRSKSNADKAKAYDELAAQSMTDAEKLDAATKRAEDAEKRLAQYEEEAQRAKDAAEVSEQYGVPASLLTEYERKAMELQAQAIRSFAEGQPTAQVFHADGKKPTKPTITPQQQFADFFSRISQ